MAGNSTRISTDVTPFHAGWAYFTVDDGKFYIDAVNDGGDEKRICINPDVAFVKTFTAADWTDGTLPIPASEHGLNIQSGAVGSNVYALVNGAYTAQAFAAMDTEVSVDGNQTVILSKPGDGFSGRVILYC